jgi:NTP pyrophosphatase (non-canonical NTP hydrolase)
MKRDVIGEVINERKRQDDKWGEQNHIPAIWMNILMEEVGEASKEMLESDFEYAKDWTEYGELLENYRTELVQVAAVAVAAIECLDRANDPT